MAGLDGWIILAMATASFAGSFITIALGIGGGTVLLAVMASLMPPAALIPVHGVIQLGSNLNRAILMIRHMHWPSFAGFALGSAVGAALGGTVVVDLPGQVIQIGVGVFILFSVLMTPPRWLSARHWMTGLISSFLTMFFGATGVFVANYVKSQGLTRQSHVATHAVLMSLQHALKIVVFGILGFAFVPWLPFIALMICAGLAGTLAGRALLHRMSDLHFKTALNTMLVLIALRLIWAGAT